VIGLAALFVFFSCAAFFGRGRSFLLSSPFFPLQALYGFFSDGLLFGVESHTYEDVSPLYCLLEVVVSFAQMYYLPPPFFFCYPPARTSYLTSPVLRR